MRIDIPQDLPRRRETSPQTSAPRPQEPNSVQRHLQSIKERADQSRTNHAPSRSAPSRRPERQREAAPRPRSVKDPRESTDPRRPQRNKIPSQTIGMQLRPEERKVMLELGKFRVVRTRDLAEAVDDCKHHKLV